MSNVLGKIGKITRLSEIDGCIFCRNSDNKKEFFLGRVLSRIMIFFVRDEWEILISRIETKFGENIEFASFVPPLIVQEILISAEDHRHCYHCGFDLRAICRAIWRRLTRKSREGASTIDQQLVRTVLSKYDYTLQRKIKEILLAILLKKRFGKSAIPSMYLMEGYYGWRMNGYFQACERLNVEPRCVSLNEAAQIVARLKYPEPRDAPRSRIIQIDRRVHHLIGLYHVHRINGNYGHLDGTV